MTDVRLVRATVNLPKLRAGTTAYCTWPPVPYVAACLEAGFLVPVDSGEPLPLEQSLPMLPSTPPER